MMAKSFEKVKVIGSKVKVKFPVIFVLVFTHVILVRWEPTLDGR